VQTRLPGGLLTIFGWRLPAGRQGWVWPSAEGPAKADGNRIYSEDDVNQGGAALKPGWD